MEPDRGGPGLNHVPFKGRGPERRTVPCDKGRRVPPVGQKPSGSQSAVPVPQAGESFRRQLANTRGSAQAALRPARLKSVAFERRNFAWREVGFRFLRAKPGAWASKIAQGQRATHFLSSWTLSTFWVGTLVVVNKMFRFFWTHPLRK